MNHMLPVERLDGVGGRHSTARASGLILAVMAVIGCVLGGALARMAWELGAVGWRLVGALL
ncbi:MAG TPA: hypothetical protein PKI20_13500 [Verrucomicrobiota bacterium]|nr:hypothetical protein [Verrucomicrobiota bacterium]HQL78711.1 hypothetical protein [Verrucomicrobiota bacterium]